MSKAKAVECGHSDRKHFARGMCSTCYQKYKRETDRESYRKTAREWARANRDKTREKEKRWREKNRDKIREYEKKHADKRKIARQKLFSEVVMHYGGKCSCCGESNMKFLTIDHINNDGAEHKRKIGRGVHRWLKKNNYPEGFQTLCWNCNCGRARNGGICPHKE